MATREDLDPTRAEVVEALRKLTDLAATEEGFREMRHAYATNLVITAWTVIYLHRRARAADIFYAAMQPPDGDR